MRTGFWARIEFWKPNRVWSMKRFRILYVVLLIITLVLGMAVASIRTIGAQAQSTADKPVAKPNPSRKTSRFVSSNWTVTCRPGAKFKKMVCELSNAITDVKSKQLLVRAVIQGQPRQLVMQLPHGLALNSGVFIQVDDGPALRTDTATSAQKGVFTRTSLSASLLAAMKKGKQIKISVSAMNGKKIIILIGLNGFSVAFDKFK